MTLEEYNSSPRMHKLAVFLTVIGAESAAKILASFEDYEIEQIAMIMATLELIDDEVQRKSVEDFAQIISESALAISGGYQYTRDIVERLKGPYQAERFVSKLVPARNSSDVIKEIGEMEPRQIHNLLKSEQPQTIAFLLSYLSPRKAAEIVQLLSPEIRTEVTVRMGTIESTSANAINTVVRRLERHLDMKNTQLMQTSGGAAHLAETLNLLDRSISKTLLERIDEQNANLGASVRKRMFSFDDLARLSVVDLQRLLREVDSASLALALKPVTQSLREKVLGAMSKRAAETLLEEIEFMAAVRLRDVETSQEAIINTVRRLEEDGEISIEAEDQEYV